MLSTTGISVSLSLRVPRGHMAAACDSGHVTQVLVITKPLFLMLFTGEAAAHVPNSL